MACSPRSSTTAPSSEYHTAASDAAEGGDPGEQDESLGRGPHNHRDTILLWEDMAQRSRLTDADFERLLMFRDGLRRFLRWSEDQAKAVGLTGSQHQLLLAVRGHRGPPSIGEVAQHLLLRHHSVVELVDRAVAAGLVERIHDVDDQRVVRIRLSDSGVRKVEALAGAHLEELSRLRSQFAGLWDDLPEPGA
ncbi:MAG: winged helix-turn-helix transcriptional regulator [Acidimicrobiales bacterium]|nr:winged helix-turn-helix transcriptional regulator [Acidimicrobiales bacterium]